MLMEMKELLNISLHYSENTWIYKPKYAMSYLVCIKECIFIKKFRNSNSNNAVFSINININIDKAIFHF